MNRIIGKKLNLPLCALTMGVALLLGVFAAGCSTESGGQSTPSAEAQRNRLKIAEAMFQERCKTAGEKIYRTVDNVEGIFLMKIRPEKDNFSDQFALDDPYGRDFGGDVAIRTLLRGNYETNNIGGTRIAGAPPSPLGYLYIDAIDPRDGQRYRYKGHIEEPWQHDRTYLKGFLHFVMTKESTSQSQPRYGVTYDDISTKADREYWIAGSVLKVIDLQTKQVIAERIGYMMDQRQGDTTAGRSPWLFAADHACPSFQRNFLRPSGDGAASQIRQTQYFVEKVLKPKSDN